MHDLQSGILLALSRTLAGNLFVVGSSGNSIVLDQAVRQNIRISWKQHKAIGVPVTMMSMAIESKRGQVFSSLLFDHHGMRLITVASTKNNALGRYRISSGRFLYAMFGACRTHTHIFSLDLLALAFFLVASWKMWVGYPRPRVENPLWREGGAFCVAMWLENMDE